jgi:D-amino peptidase
MKKELLTLLVALVAPLLTSAEERPKRRIVFNDDAQVLMECPDTGTSKFIRDWLDREAELVPFNTYVFQAALPNVCNFETRAGEVYGDRFGKDYRERHAKGIRGLRSEGTDSLRVVTEHMHSKGIEVLAAVRMGDTHHSSLDSDNPLVSQFALDNPQFIILQPDGRKNETALDYSHREVREHRMAIMREIAEAYDVDGLELNFVRWAKHFPNDQGYDKAPILTKYLGEIRAMLDAAAMRRGRDRLTLGVRVPESINTCWLAGIDIASWIKSGWLDYVVVCTYNNTDPQTPIEQFARLSRPAGVETFVLMGNLMAPGDNGPPVISNKRVFVPGRGNGYNSMSLSPAEARAAAANYYAWGADGIAFWNVGVYFGGRGTPEQMSDIRAWTNVVTDPARVAAGPRSYHILPLGKGFSKYQTHRLSFPWAAENHSVLGHPNSPVLNFTGRSRMVMPFRMADGCAGERLKGRLRFWIYHATSDDELTIDINGELIASEHIERIDVGEWRSGLPGQRFEVDLADCPPLRGNNQLGVRLEQTVNRDRIPYMEELIVNVVSPLDTDRLTAVSNVPRSDDDEIKIYIAVDSEGSTGAAEYWARNVDPSSKEFRRYRELMTDDVNAAIEGCFAGGANQVYIRDDGFGDRGLIADRLDRRVNLLPVGGPLLNGLDETFDGVMLVCFHAMEGAEDGVLAHTWSSARRRRYRFNGKDAGEVAAYAIVAGHDHNVPIILATGCEGLAREVHELLGDEVVTVAVKRVRDDKSVELLPATETLPRIKLGAKTAVEKIERFKPYRPRFPITVRLQLKSKDVVDGYVKWRKHNKPDWPGRRIDDRTIESVLPSTRHLNL